MTITRFGLLPRRPGTSVAAFQEHWRTTHARLAVDMPGIARYWQNHRVADSTPPWPGFDACSEIDAADVPTHLAMRTSEAYRERICFDEPLLLDIARGYAVWTRRTLRFGRDRDAVRLLTFIRLAPLQRRAELECVLGESECPDGATGREVFVALDGHDAEQLISAYDAVETLWFPSIAAAEAHLRSPSAEGRRWALAGVAAGTERLLATVVAVA
jgi:hypothetical protein